MMITVTWGPFSHNHGSLSFSDVITASQAGLCPKAFAPTISPPGLGHLL